MRVLGGIALLTIVIWGTAGAVQASDLAVKGVHLCCGQCVSLAKEALTGIDGVSDVNVDRSAKSITLKAADEKAAKAAIEKLADAGFHGAATLDTKEIAFPESGAKKGDKAKTVVISGVHLCCPACVEGVKTALKDREDIKDQQFDRTARTVTLTGSDVDIVAAIAALNKAGFHGIIKTDKK